jgi:cytochrome P450
VILYRLTAHPLAKYPGPLPGRITGWYSVYHAYTGTRHLDFHALHAKYGDIVRYGPNALSFNRADALQGIYGFKANVQKAHFYSAFPAAKGAWSTHSAIDRALHARKRRVLSQAFSDNAVRGLTPHILGVIRTFTDAIGDFGRPAAGDEKKGWSTPKDMAEYTNYMSYDVLGDICYGQSFETLEREENRFAMHMVAQSSRFHYLNAQMPLLKKFGLDRVLFRDLRARRTRFMAYSRARLQQRIQVGTDNDRRDFFYYLLNAKDPETGEGFPMQELWGESNVLLIAGMCFLLLSLALR